MVIICPLDNARLAEARQMILETAHLVDNEQVSLAELEARLVQRGIIKDLDDVQGHYFARNGTFLMALDQERVVGTGAVRPLEGELCELKRLWLRPAYWGKGVGPLLMQELLAFARQAGYRRMQLTTDRVLSARAVSFYTRLGFVPVESTSDDPDDLTMELAL